MTENANRSELGLGNTSPRGSSEIEQPEGISRRGFLKLMGVGAGVAAAGSVLAACGKAAPAASTSPTKKPVFHGNLEMWTFSASRSVWEKNMAKRFMALHPGVKIAVTVYPYYTMHDKLAAAILSGSGAPQLSDVEVNEIGRFFRAPIGLIDEGPLIAAAGGKSLFYEGEAFVPATWRGTTYGIGSEVDPVIFYVRSDMLEKVGIKPPTDYTTATPVVDTWDDFVTIGKEIKKATGHYMMQVDYAIGTGQWDMISLGRGGGLFDSAGSPQVDSDINIETLTFLHDLIYKHKIAIPSPGGNQSTTAGYTSLSSSLVVSSLDAEWFGYYIKKAAPNQSGKWIIQRAPRWPTGPHYAAEYGGTWQVIPKQNSQAQQELAWEFIQFMTFQAKNIVDEYTVGALFPTLKAASEGSYATIYKTGDPYFSNQSIGLLTETVAPTLKPEHTSPIWTDLVLPNKLLPATVFEPVLKANSTSPATALAAAQKKALQLYKSAGF